jgi:hypothetical protein
VETRETVAGSIILLEKYEVRTQPRKRGSGAVV